MQRFIGDAQHLVENHLGNLLHMDGTQSLQSPSQQVDNLLHYVIPVSIFLNLGLNSYIIFNMSMRRRRQLLHFGP